ncbi:MAG: 50S ribosome-binding GTPase, partial [Erysipelotrichaceae bacterium]|nr:50S ribosome-binding GTPase [Erysipelotrichaceae bacterium]
CKDIVLCITKRDLLPDTTGNDKLAHFLLSRLEEKNVSVRQIVVTGDYGKDGADEVRRAIFDFAYGREIVIMGVANAGKSTLLNALLGQNEPLTMSYHPGTTLGFTKLNWEGYTLYDSPGLHTMNSMIFLLDDKQLRTAIPRKQIKPKTFQCTSDQSFALGGLARIDIYSDVPYSVTAYVSEQLPIHRGKTEGADELWKNHYGELLKPTVGKPAQMKQTKMNVYKEGTDICIHGIGWLCIKGDVKSVKVFCNKNAKATCRKAMI